MQVMAQCELPTDDDDIDVGVNILSTVLYDSAKDCRSCLPNPDATAPVNRWEGLLESNDDAKVWRFINWKGELSEDRTQVSESPSDEEFKEHFNEILNPNYREDLNHDCFHSYVYSFIG